MNQSTRTIVFFSSIAVMFIYYLMVIPILPMALEHETLYANYTFASFFIFVPLVQMILRKRILHRYKADVLFEFKIHDPIIVQQLIYWIFAYLLIIRPLTPNLTNFEFVESVHVYTFIGWLVFSEILMAITYKTTKAGFSGDHILIDGMDFRIDFPFGNALYSQSGVYFYDDFDHFIYEGDRLIMTLKGDLGKVVIKVPNHLQKQVGEFLKAKQVEMPRNHF